MQKILVHWSGYIKNMCKGLYKLAIPGKSGREIDIVQVDIWRYMILSYIDDKRVITDEYGLKVPDDHRYERLDTVSAMDLIVPRATKAEDESIFVTHEIDAIVDILTSNGYTLK